MNPDVRRPADLAMPEIVECVPNFSEGRRKEVVDAIAQAIASVPGVRVLDQQMDADHNRSVITFVGDRKSVAEAAFQAARKAVELIDMNHHRGEHPRVGALDVLPFVPIAGVTMDDCVDLARAVGKRIADELRVPVYLYEAAATRPDRRGVHCRSAARPHRLEREPPDHGCRCGEAHREGDPGERWRTAGGPPTRTRARGARPRAGTPHRRRGVRGWATRRG